MSWRCACLFSLPILVLYAASFFMPAWQDGNGIYTGYETLGKGFDLVDRQGDVGSLMLLLFPNLLAVTGIVVLAIPKTWARIVAAGAGFVAMLASALIMICINFLSFFSDLVGAIFGSAPGPSGVREGFFVWISSMFALMMVGLITAIVSGTRAAPARRDDDGYRRRPRSEDEDYRSRPRRSHDDDSDDGPLIRRR